MATTLEVPCFSVVQPIGEFYLGKLSAADVIKYVSILRRGLSEEEQKYVQRQLADNRQREIADFVTDPDATFPTSIIVSVHEDVVTIDKKHSKLIFKFDDKLGEVLDGQHRLEGLHLAMEEGAAKRVGAFELPVVFMLNLSPDDKAYIFSVINSKQTKVPTSLIFDLFGMQTSRSPKKTCHDIAQSLNTKEDSPFYRGVKMLGNKIFESEYLTQGAFAKYLLKLISKTPEEDARREKAKKPLLPDPDLPFRDFYIRREDGIIAKVMENYFGAMSEIFKEEWSNNPQAYLLRKTAGYSALITVLDNIWSTEVGPKKKATKEVFLTIARRLKEGLDQRPRRPPKLPQ
jgi:DGQHR domain-containing protein